MERICWFGSLDTAIVDETVEGILPACDRAVSLAPQNGSVRSGRGLARALTGDMTGAIADFEVPLWRWRNRVNAPEDLIASRENWIAELKAGGNPFNEATLRALRSK